MLKLKRVIFLAAVLLVTRNELVWCDSGCGSDWELFGDNCYKFITEKKNQNGAQNHCLKQGSHLTSIHSNEEVEFLNTLNKNGQRMWIGGERVGKNSFKWIDRSEFDYENWDTNEPNNIDGKENCMETLSNAKWNDIGCTYSRPFVCKRPFSDPIIETTTTIKTTSITPTTTMTSTNQPDEKSLCDSLTVADCKIDPDTILPEHGVAGVPEEVCQSYCNVTLGCMFYRYEKMNAELNTSYCTLLKEDYRRNCGIYGADMDTDLTSCIEKNDISNTCDEFIKEDCDYSLEEIAFDVVPGSISNTGDCKEMCDIFSDVYGCRYYVFEDENNNPDHSSRCTLYKSSDNMIHSCNVIHGPKSPYHSQCGPVTE